MENSGCRVWWISLVEIAFLLDVTQIHYKPVIVREFPVYPHWLSANEMKAEIRGYCSSDISCMYENCALFTMEDLDIKSNAMIKTKTYCDTRPFIGVHTVLFGESIVPRSYNRYRGGRNSVSSRRLVVFLEQVRQEADRNIISNYLAMHGH